MKKISKKHQTVICYLALIVIFLLMGNSNNDPSLFINKIFKPIKGDSWTIYYSGLIIILGIYYSLKYLNEVKEKSFIKTRFKRIVVTLILIIVIFPAMWGYCIKFYKGFSKDLNSIYFDRENSVVSFNGNEDKVTVNGNINIKNCSNSTQKFYIKIKTPYLAKDDIKKDYITLNKEIIMDAKENRTVTIDEELKFDRIFKNSGYNLRANEYILFNDIDEAIFKGRVEEYNEEY